MSSYRVALAASAEKELHGLTAKVVARIMPRLERLATAPRPPGCKKLKVAPRNGASAWATGALCTRLTTRRKTIDVTRIAHRRELYE